MPTSKTEKGKTEPRGSARGTGDRRPERPARARAPDRIAQAYPEDATSMSVPPPSGEAREASEAVGSPQATGQILGPSPPNKTSDAPAPPTGPGSASSSEPAQVPAAPPPESVAPESPAKETLEALATKPAGPAQNPETQPAGPMRGEPPAQPVYARPGTPEELGKAREREKAAAREMDSSS